MEAITKHNSQSMKTVVETYIIEETQELIYDNEKLDQWNGLVQSLGLTGQTAIQVKDKSPIPFLHMKRSLVNVFTTLCPRKVDIETYDKSPIPVEILSLVSLSTKEEYFDKIQVWYDDQSPDPACIGLKQNSRFDPRYPTWEDGFDKYLIGRWADVKQSLLELTAKAKKLYMATRKSQIEQSIRDEHRRMEDLEHTTNLMFGNDDVTLETELPF
jgi:hypothetical protein